MTTTEVDSDMDRVIKANFQSFLERIYQKVPPLLANKHAAYISKENLMTGERISGVPMNQELGAPSIIMEQHTDMMNPQQSLLFNIVEVVRKQLIARGIVLCLI